MQVSTRNGLIVQLASGVESVQIRSTTEIAKCFHQPIALCDMYTNRMKSNTPL